jgi:transposase InsO family protein
MGSPSFPGQRVQGFRRNHLIEADRKRRRTRAFRRFQRARPMELWQLDVTGGVLLEDGPELKVVPGVDDRARFCVLHQVVERATARAVCRAFSGALRRYCLPRPGRRRGVRVRLSR